MKHWLSFWIDTSQNIDITMVHVRGFSQTQVVTIQIDLIKLKTFLQTWWHGSHSPLPISLIMLLVDWKKLFCLIDGLLFSSHSLLSAMGFENYTVMWKNNLFMENGLSNLSDSVYFFLCSKRGTLFFLTTLGLLRFGKFLFCFQISLLQNQDGKIFILIL